MSKPRFYCVLGNRDTLKVRTGGTVEKVPIWQYIPHQETWLTSLVYLRGVQRPPDSHFLLDCGAWSYKGLPEPRWSPGECMEMYAAFAQPGDIVAAPDHMVLRGMSDEEEHYRVTVTLENARVFKQRCPSDLIPLGVTHGNTLATRVRMTNELLGMGYRYLAIGSVAIRAGNRAFIRAVLDETMRLRQQEAFQVHVLGVSALSWYTEFAAYGVDSYDGSSMFFKAFTGGGYYWLNDDGQIVSLDARTSNVTELPLCSCPVCTAMREQGIDTRQMGSNENNMGRAVHNINIYRQALAMLQGKPLHGQGRLGL